MDLIVRCNNCGETFNSNQMVLKEQYLGAMYTETFFNTPCCNHKMLVCIKDNKCRQLEDKLHKQTSKDLSQIQKDYKKHMDIINGKR